MKRIHEDDNNHDHTADRPEKIVPSLTFPTISPAPPRQRRSRAVLPSAGRSSYSIITILVVVVTVLVLGGFMIVDIQLIQSNTRSTTASYYMMTTHMMVVPSYTTTTTTTTTISVNDTGEGEEGEGEPTVATATNSSRSEFHHHQIDISHDHHRFSTLLQHQHDRIFFVHVGKAGGSTLSQQLRIRCHWMGNEMHRKQCLREWQQQQQQDDDKESELSQRIIGHIHATIQDVIWPLTASSSTTTAATTASTKIVRTRSGDATAVATKHASSSTMITSYLFVIRSPVDRIFSWFRFIHPGACRKIHQKTLPCEYLRKSQLFPTNNNNNSITTKHDTNALLIHSFATCFPTAQHFLSSLSIGAGGSSIGTSAAGREGDDGSYCHNNGTVVMNHPCHCAQTAHAILQAKTQDVAVMGHSYYNYNYYANRTIRQYPNKHVLAIRTEHFWSDFDNLNQLLRPSAAGNNETDHHQGGHAFSLTDNHTRTASITTTTVARRKEVRHVDKRNLPINMTVTAVDIFYLCCALFEAQELQVYWEILQRADNLDATAKRQSQVALLQQCSGGGGGGGERNEAKFQSLDELGAKCREARRTQKGYYG